jgi:secreted trypsin-like serine protease
MVLFYLLLTLTCFLNQTNGTSSQTRVIGGEDARAGQFPFAAAIQVQTSTSRFFCGGTLTANQWVATSGHCVYNGVVFTIQLGSIELVSDDPNRVTVSSSTYILHPDFNPETIENDIGLIKLRMSVEYHIYLHPIHPREGTLSDNASVYVLGWGQTSDSNAELSNSLQYSVLSVITNAECRITYGNQITDKMVCAIGNYNEGTCTGDNGGGMVVQNGRTYALVGIASFVSSDGCESIHPSGFTRTAPYYEWMTNITKETDD